MAFDIVELILLDILKISSDLISQYSTVADQLIYLILLPMVIVLLFVWTFGSWVAPENPRFRTLVTIVSFIVLIYSGWYGSFIVPIIVNWFMIFLGLSFVFFILIKVIHPIRGPGIYKFADAAASSIKKATFGKQATNDELERELKIVNQKIAEYTAKKANAPGQAEQAYFAAKLDELNGMKKEIEKRLRS